MRVLFLVAVLAAPLVLAEPTPREVQDIHLRDFHAKGIVKKEAAGQDAVQRICTMTNDRPSAEIAKQIEADQMKTIAFPEGSLIGDWQRGERIAQNGRGLQWTDPAGPAGGGSCYNCHQLSPQETSHGTIGPSLLRFGATRGSGPEMQRYVYGKIYNAKAYSLCSQMPRLGHSGTLTSEQIRNLVGLLLDSASPVNQ